MRTRTVGWIEGRILEVLGKVKKGKEPCLLSLSAMTLNYAVRSVDEQHNFDFALFNLLRKKLVLEDSDEKGFKIYKLVA